MQLASVWITGLRQLMNWSKWLALPIEHLELLSYHYMVCCCIIQASPIQDTCSYQQQQISLYWKFSCISGCSSLPISAYLFNMSPWLTKYFLSHHFEFSIWPWWEWHSATMWGGGAPRRAFDIFLGDKEITHIMLHLGQDYNTSLVHLSTLDSVSPSANRQLEKPANDWISILSIIAPSWYCNSWCLPKIVDNMLPTNHVPFSHLKYLTICSFSQGFTVVFALPQSTKDSWCVHSHAESKPMVSHLQVMLLTTS